MTQNGKILKEAMERLSNPKNAPVPSNKAGLMFMQNGGGLLSKSVTCSGCGHSWKSVEGGSDPLTCHNCGGMVRMDKGGQSEGPGPKKPQPIYVDNPRDPRLRAYSDSLSLYKQSLNNMRAEGSDPDYKKLGFVSFKNAPEKLNSPDAFEKNDRSYPFQGSNLSDNKNIVFNEKIKPTGFDITYIPRINSKQYSSVYKKPVQPVVYKKPEPTYVEKFGLTNEDVKRAFATKPISKKNGDPYYNLSKGGKNYKIHAQSGGLDYIEEVVVSKPQPKKQESVKENQPVAQQPIAKQAVASPAPVRQYTGSPVYSPGAGSGMPSALVGFRSEAGDTAFIQPDDYQRFAVPAYGRDYIQSQVKKFAGGGQTRNEREMVNGIADILSQVNDEQNRAQIARQMINDFNNEDVTYNYDKFMKMSKLAAGGMIRRADGSYSKRGLWDNIRANAGSGKKPTREMLEQERKIKSQEMAYGGTSIVDYLNSEGMSSDKATRNKLAQQFNIQNYDYSAAKNLELLERLKQSKNIIQPAVKTLRQPAVINQPQVNSSPAAGVKLPMYSNNYNKPANEKNLESGMVVDKRTNTGYIVKGGKAVKSFPVLTGKNSEGTSKPWNTEETEGRDERKITPAGTYTMAINKHYPDIYGAPGFYINPIAAFNEPAPIAKDLAVHQTYDPANRNMFYNMSPDQRYQSYGCINCRNPDMAELVKEFPQSDTLMVLDPKMNKQDRLFLDKLNSQKANGGLINKQNMHSIYDMMPHLAGGGTNNPGFEALPPYVQAKILSNMGLGGYYNPYMEDGGSTFSGNAFYGNGGYYPMYAEAGPVDPNGRWHGEWQDDPMLAEQYGYPAQGLSEDEMIASQDAANVAANPMKPTKIKVDTPKALPGKKGQGSGSIVDFLNSQGAKSDFATRKAVAENIYGFGKYTGSAEQNKRLLAIMSGKEGYSKPQKGYNPNDGNMLRKGFDPSFDARSPQFGKAPAQGSIPQGKFDSFDNRYPQFGTNFGQGVPAQGNTPVQRDIPAQSKKSAPAPAGPKKSKADQYIENDPYFFAEESDGKFVKALDAPFTWLRNNGARVAMDQDPEALFELLSAGLLSRGLIGKTKTMPYNPRQIGASGRMAGQKALPGRPTPTGWSTSSGLRSGQYPMRAEGGYVEGQEMDVTPEQMERLRQQGYQFEII